MGNVSSKPLTGPTSTPTSPTKHTAGFSTGAAKPTTASSSTAPAVTRSSFTIDSSSREKKVQQHQRSQSHSVRPFFSRSQHSDSGNSTGKSQNELVSVADNSTTTITTSDATAVTVTPIATPSKDVNVCNEEQQQSAAMPSLTPISVVLDKPLPASPLVSASASVSAEEEAATVPMHPHSSPTLPSKDTITDSKSVEATRDNNMGSSSEITASALTATAAPSSPPHNGSQKNSSSPRMTTRIVSLTQQSIHSQSSLSDKSISSTSTSSGSGNRSSNNSTHTFTTRTTVTRATTTESLGQLSLQRFPTGESEYKNSIIDNSKKLLSRSKAGGEQSRKLALDAPIKTSRTTSMVSTSSARSSSGSSSGFKFVKPNLSFKPLLYNLGNDSKNQQRLYQHHNNSSTSSASPNASHHRQQHQQALDPFANSPFPSILLSIQLPQSLLDKYVMDVESFRHGKGIWGIGKYSWTVTVLARANGKRYVIKRVSKSLLPPSAYYHYPTTAHRLCTCPACKSSRDQLLRAGQLDQEELENIQEVLVIQNNGRRKELPQLPSSASQQNHQQGQQQRRPLSASSAKEKKNALNLYRSHNASMPNHQGQSLTFSPNATPQDTPVNSRPSTPSQSPLRQQSSPPLSEEKIHNRSQSHCHTGSTPLPAAQSLSMSATVQSALSWQHKDVDPPTSRARSKTSAQTPEQLSHCAQTSNIRPNSARLPPSSTSTSINRKGRPILRRSASTPNLSQTVTGLDVLEDDPARVEQLKQLSRSNRNDWLPHGIKNPWQAKDLHSATFIPLQSTADVMTTKEDGGEAIDQKTMNESLSSHNEHVQMVIERKVSPFDTNEGEFKQLEPAPLRSPTVPLTFVPPPHALPMELVLLQTYNDSDHLPEHHEWTQDQEYWYYVTKAHGVKRRKLKKVSSWWLDMGSLGGALLSGSSSSNEPIATGPIYNMGRVPGTTSPLLSSPLSSEATLPMTDSSTMANKGSRHIAKESISSITSQESSGTTTVSFNTLKRQSSPRNSHMGKYYYVNWDEYISL